MIAGRRLPVLRRARVAAAAAILALMFAAQMPVQNDATACCGAARPGEGTGGRPPTPPPVRPPLVRPPNVRDIVQPTIIKRPPPPNPPPVATTKVPPVQGPLTPGDHLRTRQRQLERDARNARGQAWWADAGFTVVWAADWVGWTAQTGIAFVPGMGWVGAGLDTARAGATAYGTELANPGSRGGTGAGTAANRAAVAQGLTSGGIQIISSRFPGIDKLGRGAIDRLGRIVTNFGGQSARQLTGTVVRGGTFVTIKAGEEIVENVGGNMAQNGFDNAARGAAGNPGSPGTGSRTGLSPQPGM